MKKAKNILVTGGKGFIGALLAKQLEELGHRVSVLDLPKGDIRHYKAVEKAIKGKDVVYHLAAVADLNWAKDHPQETYEINIGGTNNVALACARRGALLNFVSTCCVYGNQKHHPSHEESLPNPAEIYACSKVAGEYLVKGYAKLYGMKYNLLRIATTYGPGMRPALAIYIFLDRALRGEKIFIHGNGKQTRTMTYIDDEVEGLVRVIQAGITDEIINISTEEETSALDWAKKSLRLCGRSPKDIIFSEDRPGQVYREAIDVSRAKKLLGWRARVSLDQGLKKTLRWLINEKRQKTHHRRR